MIRQQRKERLSKMGKVVDFPDKQRNELLDEIFNILDEIFNTEEHINEIRDLIGYEDSPKFKIIKGGLE